ncbi:DUF397 domain-containing protein [Actinocorallia longicatena]|uniref:DUF397 domain-containing protein n=2 Tax=Actinocorallia longicatena TaxID=111803 RepID=A0ABP6QIF6_9ACTN
MASHPHAGWRKSSFSGANSDECVEVADAAGHIVARDSKHPDGTVLAITRSGWRGLVRGLKRG